MLSGGQTSKAARTEQRLQPQASSLWTLKFTILLAWLALVFALGGTSRPETGALIFLRPAAIALLAFGLATLSAAEARAHRALLLFSVAIIALHTFHLVPLPPDLWRQLPGRDLVVEIDQVGGLGNHWRPLSLAPDWTWNSLWAFMVPLSVLVLGIQLNVAQQRGLLMFVILAGAISAVLGLLQLLGDPQSALNFHSSSNNRTAVGLFANRNHQAVLLAILLPAIVVQWAIANERARAPRQLRLSMIWAIAAIAFVAPLIFVTGSRAGLLVGLFAVLLLPLVFWAVDSKEDRPSDSKRKRWWLLVAVGLVALIAATIILGRGLALDRLLGSQQAEEARLLILPIVLEMIEHYAPWGTGLGSFEPVYQVHEPASLLHFPIVNRAHNDWAEVALTGGLPAMILLGLGLVMWLRRTWTLVRPNGLPRDQLILARLGLLILLLLALASTTDYPVRMPSLSCLAAIAVLWAAGKSGPMPRPRSKAKQFDQQSWLGQEN